MQRTNAGHPTCDSTSEPGSSTEKSDSVTFLSSYRHISRDGSVWAARIRPPAPVL
jgi:hypothetical protein